ncbi:S-layer homology domain-containing protein, partial [Aedoeadaptatus acetigenes]|uniref:S-layer homology domain-containing protein n=1 Tax=Aedoeadaptatus acetigenes TaxID=2981723 RepID=UPI0011DC773A
DKEAIDKIVNEATKTNNERAQAKKELAKVKEEAKATVDQLDELSKDEKTNTKASIDQAADKEAIDKIVNEATKTNNERAEAKKALLKAKEKAKATVDLLDELTDKEKKEIKSKIDKAADQPGVTALLEEAKHTNNERAQAKKELAKAKEEAKKEVDKLPNLSEETKNGIKDEIDKATNKEQIDKLVEDATNKSNAAAENALADKKEEAKKEVDKLPNLSEETKNGIKDEIDKATNKEQIDKLVEDATNKSNAAAENALVDKKEEAKKEVDKLPNLSEETKNGIKDEIDKATNKEQIDKLVEDATNKSNAAAENALADKKEEAKKEVDKLPNLSEETKNGIKDEIDNATNKEQIDKLVEDATNKSNAAAEKALADKKEEAKKEVDKLPNLSEDTKNGIKEKIDEAGDVGAVNKIVEEAKKENTEAEAADKEFAERVKRAKEEARIFMDSMDKSVLDSQSIRYLSDDVKGKIEEAINHSNSLLADEAIDEAKLKEIENIPSKKVNGKKTGIFRAFTKQALVDYEVLGTRDQLNPHNNKNYVALKDNKIEIRSNLEGAGKIGENEEAFFKLNYVTQKDFEEGKPKAVSSPSTRVDTSTSATPKYKKQEVPRDDYTVKQVAGGYEIEITKLPENAKYIKPIVYVKFANDTYFENGDMVAVTAAENPGTPSTPVVPNNNRRSGRGSSSHSIWMTTGQSSQEKKSEPVLQAEAPKVKHQAFIFGYGDNSFRPGGKISRAEAASMIASLAGLDTSNKAKPDFKDTDSSWYNEVINAMVKNDLMLADKNGNFRPNEPITRAEFARALAGIDKKTDRIAPFADVKGHPFEAAINQAFGNGRIIGYPDGTFKPDGAITRAEAVTILNRYDGRTMSKQDLMKIRGKFNSFKDVSENHWAYVQILMAANNYQAMLDALAAHK